MLASNSLVSGRTYTFSLLLEVTNDSRFSPGLASLPVSVNVPPANGNLDVRPAEGVAIEDVFYLSSSNWVDDDPSSVLTYYFGYFADPDLNTDAMSIEVLRRDAKPLSTLSFTNDLHTRLPVPTTNNQTRMQLVVFVTDSNGATSFATQVVTVKAPKDTERATNLILGVVNRRLVEQDSPGVLSAARGRLSLLGTQRVAEENDSGSAVRRRVSSSNNTEVRTQLVGILKQCVPFSDFTLEYVDQFFDTLNDVCAASNEVGSTTAKDALELLSNVLAERSSPGLLTPSTPFELLSNLLSSGKINANATETDTTQVLISEVATAAAANLAPTESAEEFVTSEIQVNNSQFAILSYLILPYRTLSSLISSYLIRYIYKNKH